jgi:hypothetical protein
LQWTILLLRLDLLPSKSLRRLPFLITRTFTVMVVIIMNAFLEMNGENT